MAGAGYLLFTAGQVLTAAQVNTYLMQQSNMVFATTAARDAALTTVKSEGMITYQLDNNDLDIYNGTLFGTLIAPAHGALTSWTPAVVQSVSVTTTNNGSTTMRMGRLIYFNYNLTVTGAGTAANLITVTMPVTSAGSVPPAIGYGWMRDSSAAQVFGGIMVPNSTTVMKYQNNLPTGVAELSYLGTGAFTAALASGDALAAFGWYEAGADA